MNGWVLTRNTSKDRKKKVNEERENSRHDSQRQQPEKPSTKNKFSANVLATIKT
jgi:hypothetical protein